MTHKSKMTPEEERELVASFLSPDERNSRNSLVRNDPAEVEVNSQTADPNPIIEDVKIEKQLPAEPRKRKNRPKENDSYVSLFMRESDYSSRSGKTVNIRKEHHEILMKILRIVGEDKVSLFSYIDNIMAHHFETHKDEITVIYDRKQSLFPSK